MPSSKKPVSPRKAPNNRSTKSLVVRCLELPQAGWEHISQHPVWSAVTAGLIVAMVLAAGAWARSGFGADGRTGDGSSLGATASAEPGNPTSTPDWRDAEFSKLDQLKGGLSLQRFEEVLGTPLFVTRSRDGGFTQSLFRGRGYWVQAVSDNAGEVQLMAVTSCDDGFRPHFIGVTTARPSLATIVLNETRFDQTGTTPTKVRYFTSGATANSFYYDEYYLGNPGLYKTYFVGINDACPFANLNGADSLFVLKDYRDVPYDSSDTNITTFRANAVANTYGETAAFADPAALKSFQIGADRILTRTAPTQYAQ
jgi:hypothetical protein